MTASEHTFDPNSDYSGLPDELRTRRPPASGASREDAHRGSQRLVGNPDRPDGLHLVHLDTAARAGPEP